jgi:hypothetical protein
MGKASRELDWPTIFVDFRRSGLTQAQFCELRRIPLLSFRYWLYRLRPGLPPQRPRSSRRGDVASPVASSVQNSVPAFLPVHVRPRPLMPTIDDRVPQPPTPLELILSERCHLRVPTGFDPDTLHQVLDVLEERG